MIAFWQRVRGCLSFPVRSMPKPEDWVKSVDSHNVIVRVDRFHPCACALSKQTCRACLKAAEKEPLSPQPLRSEWVTQHHKRVMSELRQCPVALLQISTYMVRRSSAHSWGGGWNSHTAMRRNIDVRHVVNIPLISSRQKAKSADAADDLH